MKTKINGKQCEYIVTCNWSELGIQKRVVIKRGVSESVLSGLIRACACIREELYLPSFPIITKIKYSIASLSSFGGRFTVSVRFLTEYYTEKEVLTFLENQINARKE